MSEVKKKGKHQSKKKEWLNREKGKEVRVEYQRKETRNAKYGKGNKECQIQKKEVRNN